MVISVIFWLVHGFIFHCEHLPLPRCCLIQFFYHIAKHLLIYCPVYWLPGMWTCGFQCNHFFGWSGMHLRGHKCGQEGDRMCECGNCTVKMSNCIYVSSNPRESWPRFSLIAPCLPLKIIYTTFLQLLYSPMMRNTIMCFFFSWIPRETTYIWKSFRNLYELFYI